MPSHERIFRAFSTLILWNSHFGFSCYSTREDLSIDVSIINVGLILTKLRWFQIFATSQNLNFELFWKKNQINRFPWCSTREALSIDVLITNEGLILTKLRWFQLFVTSQNSNFFEKNSNFWVSMLISFLGVRTDGQTDTVLESSYGNMSAHKKSQLKPQN